MACRLFSHQYVYDKYTKSVSSGGNQNLPMTLIQSQINTLRSDLTQLQSQVDQYNSNSSVPNDILQRIQFLEDAIDPDNHVKPGSKRRAMMPNLSKRSKPITENVPNMFSLQSSSSRAPSSQNKGNLGAVDPSDSDSDDVLLQDMVSNGAAQSSNLQNNNIKKSFEANNKSNNNNNLQNNSNASVLSKIGAQGGANFSLNNNNNSNNNKMERKIKNKNTNTKSNAAPKFMAQGASAAEADSMFADDNNSNNDINNNNIGSISDEINNFNALNGLDGLDGFDDDVEDIDMMHHTIGVSGHTAASSANNPMTSHSANNNNTNYVAINIGLNENNGIAGNAPNNASNHTQTQSNSSNAKSGSSRAKSNTLTISDMIEVCKYYQSDPTANMTNMVQSKEKKFKNINSPSQARCAMRFLMFMETQGLPLSQFDKNHTVNSVCSVSFGDSVTWKAVKEATLVNNFLPMAKEYIPSSVNLLGNKKYARRKFASAPQDTTNTSNSSHGHGTQQNRSQGATGQASQSQGSTGVVSNGVQGSGSHWNGSNLFGLQALGMNQQQIQQLLMLQQHQQMMTPEQQQQQLQQLERMQTLQAMQNSIRTLQSRGMVNGNNGMSGMNGTSNGRLGNGAMNGMNNNMNKHVASLREAHVASLRLDRKFLHS